MAIKKAQNGVKKPATRTSKSVKSSSRKSSKMSASDAFFGDGPVINKMQPTVSAKELYDNRHLKRYVKKQKSGGKTMLKRKDGSVSQRGLWDNIRANKGSGKKPTAAMLKQEKKIKAKSK